MASTSNGASRAHSSENWSTSERQGLVNVDGRHVFLCARGPPRVAGQPVILFESGHGDSSRWWSGVQELLSTTHRSYAYDRAGLGRSERSSLARNGINIATELSALVQTAGIEPPYILVGHSYGGIPVREFFAQHAEDVVGLVLVDTEQEKTPFELPLPWEAVKAIIGDLDYFVVTGLDKDNKLDPDEWKAIKEERAKDEAVTEEEQDLEDDSARDLGQRHQFDKQVLGHHPLTVIKANSFQDWSRFYAAGVAAGNGTETQRAAVLESMGRLTEVEDRLMKEQLKLSSNGRYVETKQSGHNVHATQPELVAEEIRKLAQRIKHDLAT